MFPFNWYKRECEGGVHATCFPIVQEYVSRAAEGLMNAFIIELTNEICRSPSSSSERTFEKWDFTASLHDLWDKLWQLRAGKGELSVVQESMKPHSGWRENTNGPIGKQFSVCLFWAILEPWPVKTSPICTNKHHFIIFRWLYHT